MKSVNLDNISENSPQQDAEQEIAWEEQLRRSNDTFYNLVQNNPFGVYVVDADFKLRQVSLGSQKVFSNVRPLLGRDFAEVLRAIWAEPFATEAINIFRHTLETGEPFSAPSTVEQRQDIQRTEAYDWRIERITLPDGTFGVVCYFYDLSERQQWEEALRESETRLSDQKQAFEMALSGSPIQDVLNVLVQAGQRHFGPESRTAIFVLDPKVSRLNFQAAARLPVEYISAIHGFDIGPDQPTCAATAFTGETVIAADVFNDARWSPYAPLAEKHEIRACWSHPIKSPTGTVLGNYAVYHKEPAQPDQQDMERLILLAQTAALILERHQTEEALHAARIAAEQASQAKDHFLAVLSHELRTPLTPVLTAAGLMLDQTGFGDDQRELLEMIRRNVELEARLIDDLLDLTRISRGKLELQLTHVDAHEKLRQVLVMCQSDVHLKLLQVMLDLKAHQYVVQGDAARLQQVFWNLLKNAIKFSRRNGIITVRTFNTETGQLSVQVEDMGAGIDPEVLPRIFDAFEQGGRQVTRQFGGLGLGLAICKGLVSLHGGTITSDSAGAGTGAVFSVVLNTVTQPQSTEAIAPTMQPAAEHKRHRILVVEDHRDTATLMARVLKKANYEVRIAHSVKDGIEAALDEPFDLLISDIGLPDGTGLDLIQHLRDHMNVIGIALSGYGMEADIGRSRDAGFQAHLVKPVSIQLLRETVERLLTDQ